MPSMWTNYISGFRTLHELMHVVNAHPHVGFGGALFGDPMQAGGRVDRVIHLGVLHSNVQDPLVGGRCSDLLVDFGRFAPDRAR